MDGKLKAIVKEESDSEFVDMMDWYNGRTVVPHQSSFRLVWDLKSPTIRPVGLRRVTIGYAHPGFDFLIILKNALHKA